MNLDAYKVIDARYEERTGQASKDTYDKDRAHALFDANGEHKGYFPTGYAKLDALIGKLNPPIVYDESAATSSPHTNFGIGADDIHLPYPGAFHNREAYAHVVLHELSHWSQTLPGLARFNYQVTHEQDSMMQFVMMATVKPYMQPEEELTAELASILLSESLDVPLPQAAANYVSYYTSFLASEYPAGTLDGVWERAKTKAQNIHARYMEALQ